MPSLTLAEARHRAAHLVVRSYDVAVDLTDAAGSDTWVSRSRIRFASTASETFVELRGARSLSAWLDGRALDGLDPASGRVPLTGLAGEHELVVEARLGYGSSGDGVHRASDPADGATYVMAYCGLDLASSVFACLDQPDLKAPITFEVVADPSWTVLSNGVQVEADGPLRRFAPTPPISTYLFTLCAGPWHSVRFEHAGIPFAWHARASQAVELEAMVSELQRITTTCFDHYVEAFEPPYPFDSYDQVFAPGLNWGAMEFPGCVAFRDELLPRGEASAGERSELATVIAHEMAHMWFGDLVTMRWWEDSWLNESFADYMGYQISDRAAGYRDAWVDCALTRKPTGYAADERRSTHPVAEDAEAVADVDVAFTNFDMITYAKGNAVLRQLVTWLGEPDFLAGVNRHLVRHAFGNAELEDLLAALDDASERDVRAWAAAWLRTTGFDAVHVTRGDDGVPVLRREGTRPHRLSVGAYGDAGDLVGTRVVDVDAEPVTLTEYAGLAVLPNHGDETFARLRLDPLSRAVFDRRLGSVDDRLARAVLWSTAVDEARSGDRSLGDLLDLAGRHLAPETHAVVFEGVLAELQAAVSLLADPTALPDAHAMLAGVCDRALAAGVPAVGVAAARGLAATSTDAPRLRRWLADERTEAGPPLDAELRWSAVRRLVELGGDPRVIDLEAARDRSVAGELAALSCRAARPTPEAKAEAWVRMLAPDVSNRAYAALSRGLWTDGQEQLVTPYLDRYLDVTPALARDRGQGMSQVAGSKAFPRLPLPLADLRAFRGRLADRLADPEVPTVLRRSWEDRLDDLDLALRARSR